MKEMSRFLAAGIAICLLSGLLTAQQVVNTDVERVVLGFMIECYGCEQTGTGGNVGYEYNSPPIIISVARGGPGETAGLRPGDVLTHVNGVSITTRDGARLLSGAQDGKALILTIRRAGSSLTVSLTPRRAKATSDHVIVFEQGLFGAFKYGADSNRRVYRTLFDSSGFRFSQDTTFRFQMRNDSLVFPAWNYRYGGDSLSWNRAMDRTLRRDSSGWSIRSDLFSRRAQGTLNRQQWSFGNRADTSTLSGRDLFISNFAGLELTIDGTTPVKVTVVEPDCALSLDVNGTRILLRSPRCR